MVWQICEMTTCKRLTAQAAGLVLVLLVTCPKEGRTAATDPTDTFTQAALALRQNDPQTAERLVTPLLPELRSEKNNVTNYTYALKLLARAKEEQDDFDGAAKIYKEGIEVESNSSSPDRAMQCLFYNRLANIYESKNELADAEDCCQKATDGTIALLGAGDFVSTTRLDELLNIYNKRIAALKQSYFAAKDKAEKKKIATELLAVCDRKIEFYKLHMPADSRYDATYEKAASAYEIGELDSCIIASKEALTALGSGTRLKDDQRIRNVQFVLGECYCAQKRYDEGLPLLQELVDKCSKDEQQTKLNTLYLIGQFAKLNKQYAIAENAYKQFLSCQPKDQPAQLWQNATATAELGRMRARTNKDEGVRYLQQAIAMLQHAPQDSAETKINAPLVTQFQVWLKDIQCQ